MRLGIRQIGWILLFFGILGCPGCRKPEAPAAALKEVKPGERLRVVTSFLPVYSLAVQVAGEAADVENLLPPGVGPHDYQFSPRDARKLATAHIVAVNGLGLESWLEEAVGQFGGREVPRVVRLSDGLKDQLIRLEGGHSHHHGDGHGHGHHEDHGHAGMYDPHIWLDPRLAMRAVTHLVDAFANADPANEAEYRRNGSKAVGRLEVLDRELAAQLEAVRGQPLVTFHNAFGYFVRRYELNLVAVVEEVPDVAPSAKALKALYEKIRSAGVKVVFTEPQFPAKLARRIGDDLDVELAELDTIETGPLAPESYEKAMRKNATILVEHLK